MRDAGGGGPSGVQRRFREVEVELSRTDKVGFGSEFGVEEIDGSIFEPDKRASKRNPLTVWVWRRDVLEVRSETPRCESTWLARDERQFNGLGGIETRALGAFPPQDGQRDWDDDLPFLHPIYIWLNIDLGETTVHERSGGLLALLISRALELRETLILLSRCLFRRCGLGRS